MEFGGVEGRLMETVAEGSSRREYGMDGEREDWEKRLRQITARSRRSV